MIRVDTSTCALQHVQHVCSNFVATRQLAAGAASAVRVRIARASGGATEIPRAALAAARLREDMLRGEIIVFLSYRRTPGPNSLD